jgi:hypothetical protein
VLLLCGHLLVSEGDIDRRIGLVLALEQLDTGLILDPNRSTDAAKSSNAASSPVGIL